MLRAKHLSLLRNEREKFNYEENLIFFILIYIY